MLYLYIYIFFLMLPEKILKRMKMFVLIDECRAELFCVSLKWQLYILNTIHIKYRLYDAFRIMLQFLLWPLINTDTFQAHFWNFTPRSSCPFSPNQDKNLTGGFIIEGLKMRKYREPTSKWKSVRKIKVYFWSFEQAESLIAVIDSFCWFWWEMLRKWEMGTC